MTEKTEMLFARRTELEVKAQAVQSGNLGRADNGTVAKLEFIQCPNVLMSIVIEQGHADC